MHYLLRTLHISLVLMLIYCTVHSHTSY
jgi:hypothetical protein